MDPKTLRYYASHAREIAAHYESIPSPIRKYIATAFPAEAKLLDIGSGTGRDLAGLVSDGYEAYGVEPTDAFRSLSLELHPELKSRVLPGALPGRLPTEEALGKFDGVLCSAVLQHIPREHLFDAVFSLRAVLKERGRVLVSIPQNRPGVGTDARDADGRLFSGVRPAQLELLFERAGFGSIGRWQEADRLGRPGYSWAILLFELRAAGTSRPIDVIETVLSTRERKVATYKLALLRALCEIALTEAHRVRWLPDDRVAVPMDAVAERWVRYYWPLFDHASGHGSGPRSEHRTLLPQMNGEWNREAHLLAFSSELDALIGAYRRAGGLTRFVLDRRQGRLPAERQKLYQALLRKLRSTIKAGPVTYAGGAVAGGPIFEWAKPNILVRASMWKELSLVGHWIQDALLLRWADLTSRLSGNEVPPEEVLRVLRATPEAERETDDARSVYEKLLPDVECVWTGRSLRRFDVDHVVPYALWHNNDLWNLLPADPKVNSSKSDKLPARLLLRSRRDVIVHYWEHAQEMFPRRFAAEAASQTGEARPQLTTLFQVLLESVEVTAMQRACARWSP